MRISGETSAPAQRITSLQALAKYSWPANIEIHRLEEHHSGFQIAFRLLELNAAHDGSGTDFEMSLALASQLRWKEGVHMVP